MPDPGVIDEIDRLYGLESAALILRLSESAAYIKPQDTRDAMTLDHMAADQREHLQWIADLLDTLDATPGPRRVNTLSADLHYNRIETLVPRLVDDERQLQSHCEQIARLVVGEPRAADLCSRIAARHRAHVDQLEQIIAAYSSA